MSNKTFPVRLEDELYDRLKELADLEGSTMVDLVRRALRSYLPRVAAEQAEEMQERLERLHAFLQENPDALDESLEAVARAEAEVVDPLEEDLVVELEDREPEDSTTVTDQVREAIAGLG
jgi:predicted transcriptional regulator